MAAVLVEKEYTPEDLLTMKDGSRNELINGRLVEKPTSAKASLVTGAAICLLRPVARARRLGLVFGSTCGYQCFSTDSKRVRFPSASFIRRGRLPHDVPPDGHVRIAPDMALEVISPNNRAEELMQRILDYLQAGVRLVWVIYPNCRIVLVYRPDNTISLLKPDNELNGEDVIPGFACRVAELFEEIPAEATNHAST